MVSTDIALNMIINAFDSSEFSMSTMIAPLMNMLHSFEHFTSLLLNIGSTIISTDSYGSEYIAKELMSDDNVVSLCYRRASWMLEVTTDISVMYFASKDIATKLFAITLKVTLLNEYDCSEHNEDATLARTH